jgi:hypothetical protein
VNLFFPDAVEKTHFELTSFKVNKKIFTRLVLKKSTCLMLSEIEQSFFLACDNIVIYPVPNKWVKKGATFVELKTERLV